MYHHLRIALATVVMAAIFAGCAVFDRSGSATDHAAGGEDNLRVLVFSGTGWFRHPEIPQINGWLVELGADHGFDVHVTETPADITSNALAAYDVVLLNNSNNLGDILSEDQRQALRSFYENGGGFVGLHAMAVQHDTWPWLREVTGCDFDSDSNFQEARVLVPEEARDHPAVAGYGPEFHYTADWHNHTKSVTGMEGVTVLMRLDESSYEPVRPFFQERGGQPMGDDHPAAWVREYRGGRLFYTELGHDLRSLDTPFGRQHIIEGIRWAAPNN